MKDICTLHLHRNSRYILESYSSYQGWILATFLADEIGFSEFMRNSIATMPASVSTGNFCKLFKYQNHAFIYDSYNEKSPEVKFTIDQMLAIIDRWAEIIVKKPNQIVITIDENNNVTIEDTD